MVAVITPCFNQAQYLGDCLESLLQQSFTDWTCMVVDDGSTDDSFQVAEGFASRDRRIACTRRENRGPSAARNQAITLTESEYILPLDADDRLAPSCLEKLLTSAAAHPRAKVVYASVQFFGSLNQKMHLPEYSYAGLLRGNIIPVTGLYRRRDYLQTAGYDETMRTGWEDWDFWLSLLEPGDSVFRLDEALLYYRRKPNSRNDSLSEQQAFELRRYIYRKHFEAYRDHFEDPVNLAYRVKMLEKEVRRLRNRDWGTRLHRRLERFLHPGKDRLA